MELDDVLKRVEGLRGSGPWTALCPAHDDTRTSLSISRGASTPLLLHCFSGCSFEAVMAALENGAGPGPISRPKTGVQPQLHAAAAGPASFYVYTDAAGVPLFRVRRTADKSFLRDHPDANGGWVSCSGCSHGAELYGAQQLAEAPLDGSVYVVEGEKDVETLRRFGFVAVTSGGATSWRPELGAGFAGRHVVVLPDNDPPGGLYAEAVVRSVSPVAASVRMVRLPALLPKGDVSDYLEPYDGAGSREAGRRALLDAVAATESSIPTRWRPAALMAADLPAVEGFLAGGVFCRKSVGIIAGRRGVGKTFIALRLTTRIATGDPFGFYATRQGRVLLLSQEMTDGEIKARLKEMFTQAQVAEFNDRVTIVCQADFKVDSDDGVARLAALVGSTKADVVFIDALSDVKGAAKENDNDDMGAALRRVRDIVARPLNCAVIINDHMGRPKEDGTMNPRGASAKDDVAADIIHLDIKDGRHVGIFEKVRHMAKPDAFSYEIAKDDDTGMLDISITRDAIASMEDGALIPRMVEALAASPVDLTPQEVAEELGTTKALVRRWAKVAAAAGVIKFGGKKLGLVAPPKEGALF